MTVERIEDWGMRGIPYPKGNNIELPASEVAGKDIEPAYRPATFVRGTYAEHKATVPFIVKVPTAVAEANRFTYYTVAFFGSVPGNDVLKELSAALKEAGYSVSRPNRWIHSSRYIGPYYSDIDQITVHYESDDVNGTMHLDWFTDADCKDWSVVIYDFQVRQDSS